MEKPESKKSVPKLEINAGGESEQREILARLTNSLPVLFVLSKSFDLQLSAGSHNDIRQREGLQHEDELTEGLVRLENNIISVKTRDKTTQEIEAAIKTALNIFLAG